MTLRTGHASASLERELPCVSRLLRPVSAPPAPGTRALPPGGHTWDCVTCLDTWLHWLQPHHWLDTAWPASRVAVNLVLVLVVGVTYLHIYMIALIYTYLHISTHIYYV